MNFNKDFEELFASFNARSVKALIVGGYAFAFHAKPRYTKDLDIFIEPAAGNASRVIEVGRAELIRNKRASGRPIDLGDLEALE